MMDSIRFCLCGCHSRSLYVLARNPHKRPERGISSENVNGRGKEGPIEDKKSQLTKEGWREQSAEESRRDQSTEQGRQKMSQHS